MSRRTTYFGASSASGPVDDPCGSAWELVQPGAFIEVGDLTSVLPATGSIFLSAWIRHAATGAPIMYPFGFGDGSTGNTGLFVEFGSSGDVWGAFRDGNAAAFAQDVVPPNAWSHVGFSITKNPDATYSIRFFRNGVLTVEYPTTGAANPVTLSQFIIGRRGSGLPFDYYGDIADVALFNFKPDQSDAAAIYNSGTPRDERAEAFAANLQGYWRPCNQSGGVVEDLSGNDNDGTINGTINVITGP